MIQIIYKCKSRIRMRAIVYRLSRQLTDTIIANDEELEKVFLEMTEMRQHEVRVSPKLLLAHAHCSIRSSHHIPRDKLETILILVSRNDKPKMK